MGPDQPVERGRDPDRRYSRLLPARRRDDQRGKRATEQPDEVIQPDDRVDFAPCHTACLFRTVPPDMLGTVDPALLPVNRRARCYAVVMPAQDCNRPPAPGVGRHAALLVVDDIEDNRDLLTERLALLGYSSLTTAASGREALELLARGRFDLVLLDVMMPGMNGP